MKQKEGEQWHNTAHSDGGRLKGDMHSFVTEAGSTLHDDEELDLTVVTPERLGRAMGDVSVSQLCDDLETGFCPVTRPPFGSPLISIR